MRPHVYLVPYMGSVSFVSEVYARRLRRLFIGFWLRFIILSIVIVQKGIWFLWYFIWIFYRKWFNRKVAANINLTAQLQIARLYLMRQIRVLLGSGTIDVNLSDAGAGKYPASPYLQPVFTQDSATCEIICPYGCLVKTTDNILTLPALSLEFCIGTPQIGWYRWVNARKT